MKLGYSKINIIDTHKSRSLDFSSSDLKAKINSTRSKSHFDQIQTETETTQHPPPSSTSSSSSSPRPRRNDNLDDHPEKLNQKESADHHKAVFGSDSNNDKENSAAAAALRRNSSVSSMSAVKRVFSMRRCSSVSEGYSRIHDQSVTLASPIDDEEEEDDKTRSAKKKHRGGKILKACKRLFRL